MQRAIVGAVLGVFGCSVSTEPIEDAFDSVGVGSTGSSADDDDDGPVDDTGSPTGDPSAADDSTSDDPSADDEPSAGDDPSVGESSTSSDPSAGDDPSDDDDESSEDSDPSAGDPCGNGMVDPGEDCDGDADDTSCEDEGFGGGTIACADDCTLDTSACTNCGNDVVDGAEACDGADLGGGTCADFGWLGGGVLSCDASCAYDEAECLGPMCGEADDGEGACPPECSSCEDGVCIFDCPGNIIDGGPCNALDLVCPMGWPCRLLCGDAGCVDTSFTCSEGVCEIDCDGIDACDGTTVACGLQSCTATCDIFTEPELDCGTSCACAPC